MCRLQLVHISLSQISQAKKYSHQMNPTKENAHSTCFSERGFGQTKSHLVLRQEIIRAEAEVSGASERELLAFSFHSRELHAGKRGAAVPLRPEARAPAQGAAS